MALAILATLALAEPVSAVSLTSPLGGASIPVIIGRVIRALLGLSGSAALLMLLYGGFIWLTSGGKPEAIKKGKDTIVWAIIGLVVIFSAFVIVSFVLQALTNVSPTEAT